MASVLGEMVVSIVGDTKGLDSSIDKAQSKLQSFGQAATKIGLGLTAAVTVPLVGLGVAAVKSSMEMEMLEASFKTMLGSGEKATSMMDNIKKMAAATPFEATQLADAGKTLLQFGVAAQDIIPTLQMLGDASGGNAARFSSLALVFGQIQSSGRLMGQDLLQLINAGFNPLQEISERTGESVASLKKKMEQGAISADMVTESFKRATSEGGKFYKGMETASKTLEGLISTLKDDLATAGRAIVESLIPVIKDVVKWISSLAQWFAALDEEARKNILMMAGVAAAIGPVLMGIGQASQAIDTLKKVVGGLGAAGGPVMLTVAAIGLLVAGIVALNDHLHKQEIEKVKKDFSELAEEVRKAGGDVNKFYEDVLKIQGEVAMTGDQMNQMNWNPFARMNTEMLEQARQWKELRNVSAPDLMNKVGELADKYEMTKEQIADILIKHEGITPEMRAQLELIKKQVEIGGKLQKQYAEMYAERQAFAAYERDAIARQAALESATAAERAQAIEDAYKAMRVTVLQTLDAEKTEAQKIGAQIAEMEEYVWMAGSKQEADRLAALEVLKQAYIDAVTAEAAAAWSALEKAEQEAKASEEARVAEELKVAEQKAEEKKGIMEGEYETLEEIEQAKLALITKNLMSEVDAERWAQEQKTEIIKEYAQVAMTTTSDLLGTITGLYNQAISNQMDRLNAFTDAQIDANERAKQAALEAAGVADDTALESAQEQLDIAKQKGDAEAIAEAEKELKKQKILEEFAKKEEAIQKKAALKKYAIDVAAFRTNQAMSIVQSTIYGAQAIMKGFADFGPVVGAIMAAIQAGLTAAQIALIAGQSPPSPPKLAEGGIVMPAVGGVPAILAEEGRPEVVFPLDRLNEFLAQTPQAQQTDNSPMHLVVQIDSKPILDKIFRATKNKTVLISAEALV